MRSHHTRLPIELFANVIDYLARDKKSLQACTLVCQAWAHFSRRHLLKDIYTDMAIEEHYERLLQIAGGLWPHCSYVQILRIDDTSWADWGTERPLSPEILDYLIERLPNLNVLSLHRLAFYGLHLWLVKYEMHWPEVSFTVPELHLVSDRWDHWYFYHALDFFSEIDHLIIDVADLELEVFVYKTEFPPLDDLVVSSLCVRLSTVEDISGLRRLLKPTLKNIAALQLEYGRTLQLSSFGRLIEDVSAQLNSLAIDIRDPIQPENDSEDEDEVVLGRSIRKCPIDL